VGARGLEGAPAEAGGERLSADVSADSTRDDLLVEVITAVGDASDGGLAPDSGLEAGLARLLSGLAAGHGAIYVKRPTSGDLELRCFAPDARSAPAATIPADRLLALYEGGVDDAVLQPDLAREALGVEGAAMVPLRAGGEMLGALVVEPANGGTGFGAAAQARLRAAGRVLALALSNAQLFRGLQDRAREMDRQVRQLVALTEVARAVARSLDPGDVRATVVTEARRVVRARGAALMLVEPDGELRAAVIDGEEPPRDLARDRAATIVRTGEPAVSGGLAGLPVGPSGHGSTGALIVWRGDERMFGQDDPERLGGLADQATAALTNAQLLSDLRQEQAERRRLGARLVEAQEFERRRVAEDIHDGAVQELVGLSLLLDSLATEAEGDAAATVGRAATSARQTVRTLREAIFDLHPMSLQELGFTAATRTLGERLGNRGIEVELDLAAADALDEPQRTVAFRIVQEAMANAAKHGSPSRIQLRARRHEDAVELEVTDDGDGFEPALQGTRIDEGHLGLAAMRERAHLAGGEVTIDSEVGRGTTIRLRVPAGRMPGGSRRS